MAHHPLCFTDSVLWNITKLWERSHKARDDEMAQQVMALAVKPDYLSSMPRTHMVKEEN